MGRDTRSAQSGAVSRRTSFFFHSALGARTAQFRGIERLSIRHSSRSLCGMVHPVQPEDGSSAGASAEYGMYGGRGNVPRVDPAAPERFRRLCVRMGNRRIDGTASVRADSLSRSGTAADPCSCRGSVAGTAGTLAFHAGPCFSCRFPENKRGSADVRSVSMVAAAASCRPDAMENSPHANSGALRDLPVAAVSAPAQRQYRGRRNSHQRDRGGGWNPLSPALFSAERLVSCGALFSRSVTDLLRGVHRMGTGSAQLCFWSARDMREPT